MASAFVLAGLLLVVIGVRGDLEPQARAEVVVARENLTMMTTRSSSDAEAVFVMDNDNDRLLIYTMRLRGNRGRLELSERVNLNDMFRP